MAIREEKKMENIRNAKREEILEKIIEYFEENEDVFNDCIEELDAYNGYLGDEKYYLMDELDDIFCDAKPTDILYRTFYGRDDDNWHTDGQGNKQYGEFNPNRNYFYFNGYGNLVSTNIKDYTNFLDENFVNDLYENLYHIDTIDNCDELLELFEKLQEENDE